jgi:hypothetical protein
VRLGHIHTHEGICPIFCKTSIHLALPVAHAVPPRCFLPAPQVLYNLETAEELCELRGNASAIVDVVFSQVGAGYRVWTHCICITAVADSVQPSQFACKVSAAGGACACLHTPAPM